ncbi:MAG: tRNA 2-thiouridine synthesizing protein B [Halobacteriales archaeon]|jgi:tRNA 2-thiouridine synthesizing protein B
MLYLIDKPHANVGLRTARAADDPVVVLIQDGVLVEPTIEAEVYAVERDVAMRGVDLPEGIESIEYDRLVDLMFQHEVRTFV